MDLNIQNTKIELMKWLASIEDVSILNKILEIRKSDSNSYQLTQDEAQAVREGLADVDSGNVIDHSEVRKLYEQWL